MFFDAISAAQRAQKNILQCVQIKKKIFLVNYGPQTDRYNNFCKAIIFFSQHCPFERFESNSFYEQGKDITIALDLGI